MTQNKKDGGQTIHWVEKLFQAMPCSRFQEHLEKSPHYNTFLQLLHQLIDIIKGKKKKGKINKKKQVEYEEILYIV